MYTVDKIDWPPNPKHYKKWMKDGNNVLKVFGKDNEDNNILHHTYVNMMPDVRDMLRKMEYTKIEQSKAAQHDLFKSSKLI